LLPSSFTPFFETTNIGTRAPSFDLAKICFTSIP